MLLCFFLAAPLGSCIFHQTTHEAAETVAHARLTSSFSTRAPSAAGNAVHATEGRKKGRSPELPRRVTWRRPLRSCEMFFMPRLWILQDVTSRKETFPSLRDAFVWMERGDVRDVRSCAVKSIFDSKTSLLFGRAAQKRTSFQIYNHILADVEIEICGRAKRGWESLQIIRLWRKYTENLGPLLGFFRLKIETFLLPGGIRVAKQQQRRIC